MKRLHCAIAALALTIAPLGVVTASWANPIPSKIPAGAAPAAQFGGFEIAQNLWACSIIIENALHDAGLKVDDGSIPTGDLTSTSVPRVFAANAYVRAAVVCMPTATPNIVRVVVLGTSTESATAEFYRNAIRTDIMSRAKGGSGGAFTGPAVGIAPVLVMSAAPWLGTPSTISTALNKAGLTPGASTPGGEILGQNSHDTVVVATHLYTSTPPPGGLGVTNGSVVVMSMSTQNFTAKQYQDQVFGILTTTPPLILR